MKTFKYSFVFFALLFIQCKEKTAQKEIPDTKPAEELNSPDDQGTISVTVLDYYDKSPMKEVDIEIEKGGVSLGHDKTNLQGNVTLKSVDRENDYVFKKAGFTPQTIRFDVYQKIDALTLYLKPEDDPSLSMINIRGIVSNKDGQSAKNVSVRSTGVTTQTHSNGFYSLDIQRPEGTFPLGYFQGDINGSLRMDVAEDTVIIDIFIDGFTNDSILIKNNTQN